MNETPEFISACICIWDTHWINSGDTTMFGTKVGLVVPFFINFFLCYPYTGEMSIYLALFTLNTLVRIFYLHLTLGTYT